MQLIESLKRRNTPRRYRVRRAALLAAAALLFVMLFLSACNNNGGGDVPTDPAVPTERPTEVPMRDISGDTPLADSLIYAKRMANEVQTYFTAPDRKYFTLSNSVSRFEINLSGNGGRGITYFGDYYGEPYFENSMDMYAIDGSGTEWSDRFSAYDGRQNTFRLGYYYTEAHIFDLHMAMSSDNDVIVSSSRPIASLSAQGWNLHNCRAEASEEGLVYIVESSDDPYMGYKLKETVNRNEVNAVRVKIVSKVSCESTVYYYDTVSKGFNASQNTGFNVKGDGEEHTYVVNLDQLDGDLQGIRFDLNGGAGDRFLITSIEAVKIESTMDIRTDRTYHLYSDKLHQAFRFVAAAAVGNIKEYGVVWRVDAEKADKIQIRDKNGIHGDLNGIDPGSVEYVAFHIRNNGTVGIIIPSENSGSESVTVTLSDGFYEVRQSSLLNGILKKGKDLTVANRLYNDKTDGFEAIDLEAWLERNPLTEITIGETTAKTKFAGYDSVKGCYTFKKNGTDFSTAYQKKRVNKYYTTDVTVKGDSQDRKIYLDFRGSNGCLECAALLDENKLMVPMPIEVCKNFEGEFEEPFYDPQDKQYGDSIFPLSVKSGESLAFTELHLYQNWGAFALKQISSIQFFIGYYHMSTGVTESNCIAPFYVYGKDGWTLPDFRGCSGVMWSSQPQFTSVGIHKWPAYTDQDGNKYQSEYTGTDIKSYGPTYADIEYSYVSDEGSYKYTLRHVEFPQNDENRTYYTVSLEFLKDLTVNDFANSFSLIRFNSRDNNFQNFAYLDASGAEQTVDLPTEGRTAVTYHLNKGSFYYCIYGAKGKSGTDVMNYGLILRSARITVVGKEIEPKFIVNYSFDGKLDDLVLSLDEDKVSFKKGDTITLNLILLPFGDKTEKGAYHARYVYEDSVLKPLGVTAALGTVIPDEYVPRVEAVDNAAQFTLTGSRNRNTVVVSGFDVLARPKIYTVGNDGSLTEYVYNVEEYDGYQVAMAPDGTYEYSFVYEIADPSDSVTFRIEVSK